jgi:SagB-type dehydrogenase family enzyme
MKIIEEDYAQLYHLRSSNSRCSTMEPSVDMDQRPHRFRTYPGSERIALPRLPHFSSVSLPQAIASRCSVRNFSLSRMPLSQLACVLHVAYGVRGYKTVDGEHAFDRQVPSAGGLYPLELYVATQAVEGLEDGIYHYDARAHELEKRVTGMHLNTIAEMTIGQEMIRNCHFVVLVSATFTRTMWKYGQRGYRYVWIEAGHVGQNIYLAAPALGLGAVSIGGFFDSELHGLFRLPKEENPVYLITVGIEKPVSPSTHSD